MKNGAILFLNKLNSSEVKWRVATFILVILYCYAMHKTIRFRPDHFFLSLIILVFVFYGKEWGKLFLIDWFPFILFWIAYDMMRGIADSVRDHIYVIEPYKIEEALFGWLTPATIPPFYFQKFQMIHQGEFLRVFFDIYSTGIYAIHFLIPLFLGWLFWHTLNERRNFYLFIYTFTVLNILALVTFMIFPSAPPWYVYHYGFNQPTNFSLNSSGALINFDKLIGNNLFQTIWNTFNSNRFAAIPSLHSGYPTIIALFIGLRFGGLSWMLIAYPLSAWFSAVYLNHHYIIDLIIGSIYAVISYWIAKFIILPHLFDKIVDYETTSRLVLNNQNNKPVSIVMNFMNELKRRLK